jgi:hypothetical protein
LEKLTDKTPIIWTRGLRPDETWAKEIGPYGDRGGFVAFRNGEIVRFVGGISGKLVKFVTNGPTSNILKALPPGVRISEFTPLKKS